MSHFITFLSVYFELSTLPRRETMKGVDLYSPLQFFPGVQFDFREHNRKKLQQIATNREKSQKIDQIDCDFFPNEKIDLNGSIGRAYLPWKISFSIAA